MAVLHRFQLVIVCCYFSYNYPRKHFALVPTTATILIIMTITIIIIQNTQNGDHDPVDQVPIIQVETSEGRVEKH